MPVAADSHRIESVKADGNCMIAAALHWDSRVVEWNSALKRWELKGNIHEQRRTAAVIKSVLYATLLNVATTGLDLGSRNSPFESIDDLCGLELVIPAASEVEIRRRLNLAQIPTDTDAPLWPQLYRKFGELARPFQPIEVVHTPFLTLRLGIGFDFYTPNVDTSGQAGYKSLIDSTMGDMSSFRPVLGTDQTVQFLLSNIQHVLRDGVWVDESTGRALKSHETRVGLNHFSVLKKVSFPSTGLSPVSVSIPPASPHDLLLSPSVRAQRGSRSDSESDVCQSSPSGSHRTKKRSRRRAELVKLDDKNSSQQEANRKNQLQDNEKAKSAAVAKSFAEIVDAKLLAEVQKSTPEGRAASFAEHGNVGVAVALLPFPTMVDVPSQSMVKMALVKTSRVRLCKTCHKPGHIAKTCPDDKCGQCHFQRTIHGCEEGDRDPDGIVWKCKMVNIICTMCYSPGHYSKMCPHTLRNVEPSIHLCTSCNQAGHNATGCPVVPAVCSICSLPGHHGKNCPTDLCGTCGSQRALHGCNMKQSVWQCLMPIRQHVVEQLPLHMLQKLCCKGNSNKGCAQVIDETLSPSQRCNSRTCKLPNWNQAMMEDTTLWARPGCDRCSSDHVTTKEVELYNIGSMTVRCEHCNAYKFPNEVLDCCANGKIQGHQLPPLPVSVLMMFPNNQHTNRDAVRIFQEHSRAINTAYAFGSINGIHMKEAPGAKGRAPPVVVLKGAVSRLIWDVRDSEALRKENVAFAQIYYFSSEKAVRLDIRKGLRCMGKVTGLPHSEQMLDTLETAMLKHPLCDKYKSNHLLHSNAPTGSVVLQDEQVPVAPFTGAHNQNTGDPLAGLIPEFSLQDMDNRGPRVVFPNEIDINRSASRSLVPLKSILGDVDCLLYPLFHWDTMGGWSFFSKKNPNEVDGKTISSSAFYRHRLMVSGFHLVPSLTIY